MMPVLNLADGGSSTSVAALYDAAKTGSVASLNTLIGQYGREFLHRIPLTSLVETPLHLAALLGHQEFSKRLLGLIPELALEQDSEKYTPLHLAAAKGHDQLVRELMKGVGEKACLIQDQEGRIPLHLAAMRGRVPVVRELLNSMYASECLKKKVGDGESILHLCVKYNHLDVLKVVLDSSNKDEELLKMTDSRGNTVLHLAVMLKHKETVRFLLALPRVRTEVMNTLNGIGLTALDVLNHSSKDFKCLEIREIMGTVTIAESVQPNLPTLRADRRRHNDGAVGVAEAQEQVNGEARTWSKRAWYYVKRLMDYRGDWMNETKGSLMMVSSIIATVTFSAGISPPGGVWQQDTRDNTTGHPCNIRTCVAGNAVLAYYSVDDYIAFMKYNTVSLIGSLMVVFLLVSGFPLNNKFCLWFLSLTMCVTISFLGLTFLQALRLVTPATEDWLRQFVHLEYVSMNVWTAMMSVCALFLLVRLSYWLRHTWKLLPVNSYAYWKLIRRVDDGQC